MTILELERTVADFTFLDEYQQQAAAQVQYDTSTLVTPTGETTPSIYDYPPEVYHYVGVREEFGETMGEDERNPDYNRMGMLMIAGVVGANVELPTDTSINTGRITEEAIALHVKEFGDVSWHMANFLHIFDISMAEAVRLAIDERQRVLEASARDTGVESFRRSVEETIPFFDYWTKSSRFLTVAEAALREGAAPHIRSHLALRAGEMILYAANLVEVKFGVSYAQLLSHNIDKVNARILRGTVFKTDTVHGDVR